MDDVVQANFKACLAGKEILGETFNIACGKRICLNDLYREIKKILSIDIEPIYENERSWDVKQSYASIEKARKLLDYNPDYDVKSGLRLLVKWYKKRL